MWISLLVVAAGCASNNTATSVLITNKKAPATTRKQLELAMVHFVKWQCSSFIGAVQLEEYHFEDGSILGVNAVPTKVLERSLDDRIVKLQVSR